MQILHIIATLSPEAGGPSQAVRMILSHREIGYRGEVATLDDPVAPFLKTLDFPVHPLGPVSTTYGYTPKLVPWIQQNYRRFDGVIVHGLWQYCGRAARQALDGRMPYMVFTHGMLDPYFKRASRLKHLKKWLYWAPVEYNVLRDAYRVLFTSEAERDLAEQSFWLHRWNPHVVPYGVNGPPATPSQILAESFFDRCPSARGKRFLLFLGRIHRKKGCDLLIEAFGKIARRDPELHLVMAGPDQQGWSRDLNQMAAAAAVQDRVHWPGMLTGNAKWGAFFSCEAFVLPSHQENFGIAVAEALSCGKPVLLSDQVNIAPDIVRDGAGLMEPDTADGTLQLLQRWIDTSAEERARISARTFDCFRRRYDMRETAKTILNLFENAKRETGITVSA
ncbi:glycosyltransferase [Edaphobacter sp. 12200R-103]|jgi:glycosyltransferase involved in cell wall biosynthesis|uniref:glycosyltransferase n=1 Tax=Edaphobacter sp. 12200R-103 TaxID=2703788 RepID=UPI00138C85DF|nr:glycosyltransferase [Edaphobacter sp. 12200R-103]QHS51224.1 glycosyltransferase [Edaphobacter sp. 12200R-103]